MTTKKDFPGAVWLDWENICDNYPDFKAADREGWLITSFGCLIPVQASVNAKDLKNIRKALGFQEIPVEDMVPFPQDWPSMYQHSSLCHDHLCCNPYHFVFEHQWRNIRRNFCRGFVNDQHDCNMKPPCLSVYRKTHNSRNRYELYKGPFNHKNVESITLGKRFPKFSEIYDPLVRFEKKLALATKRAERRRSSSIGK